MAVAFFVRCFPRRYASLSSLSSIARLAGIRDAFSVGRPDFASAAGPRAVGGPEFAGLGGRLGVGGYWWALRRRWGDGGAVGANDADSDQKLRQCLGHARLLDVTVLDMLDQPLQLAGLAAGAAERQFGQVPRRPGLAGRLGRLAPCSMC